MVGGGTEMMSLPKKGLLPMGANNPHLQELHPQSHQGVCADAIATLEGIDRRGVDEHAAESQRRAEIAIKEGRFDRSLIPVHNPDGTLALDRDEYPRPGTTADSLAELAPSFPRLADHRFDEDPRPSASSSTSGTPTSTSRTSITPATRPGSSMVRPPSSMPAPTTCRPTGSSPGPASSPAATWVTTRP